MNNAVTLETLFFNGRTHSHWLDKPVDDAVLKELFNLVVLAPSSANCEPIRVVFVKSAEAKARLKPLLDAGNVEKTMTAPVTAIIGMDMEFYEKLPQLFPHADARSWFAGKPQAIETTAMRNSSIEGGYFILAARALGLDVGPMSGFNNAAVDKEFFPGGTIKSNFLCNLGYGDRSKLHPRLPRLSFEEACEIV